MLTFLTGLDRKAKRAWIAGRLLAAAGEGKTACLLVPEQSSSDRERELLRMFGDQAANRIRVLSFRHFSREILLEHGKAAQNEADEAAKAVIMSLALFSLGEQLTLYRKCCDRAETVRALISFFEELDRADMTPEKLRSAAGKQENRLREKLEELSLIGDAYRALLGQRFSSDAEDLRRAAALVAERDLYRGAVFFADDFRGFTGGQLRFLSALAARAELTVSLTQGETGNGGALVFEHAEKNRRRLTRLCPGEKKMEDAAFPLPAHAPAAVAACLFENAPEIDPAPCDSVQIVAAQTVYDEAAFIAGECRRLLEDGLRARDIAIFHRDSAHVRPLQAALRQQGLPVYEDRRRPLTSYPLVRLMLAAAQLAANGPTTQNIFALLKTGVAGVSETDTAELENYVYRWQIDRGAWLAPFTRHPRGYGQEMEEEDANCLMRLNTLREGLLAPIGELREALSTGDVGDACRGMYRYLIATEADRHFLDYAGALYDAGDEPGAKACQRVWDACMDALDALAAAAEGQQIPPAFFAVLLQLILSGAELGDIPAGLDQIVIGHLERTRFLSPKAVFVCGMQADVLPLALQTEGVLTLRELRSIAGEELLRDKLPEDRYEEERLIAFNTLSAPEERLYLCYHRATATGEALEPSPLIARLQELRPAVQTVDLARLPREARITAPAFGFEALGAVIGDNTVFSASLAEALSADPAFAARVDALRRARRGVPGEIASKDTAMQLFGEDLSLSASRIEKYAECPFAYFCRYGLKITRLRPERLDARIFGLLIHAAMDEAVTNHRLTELNDKQLRAVGDAAADRYVESKLGGTAQLPPAVLRTIGRAKDEIFEILKRLRAEFADSLFHPVDAELKIGGKDGALPSYRLDLPDGTAMRLSGAVDRVDLMEMDGFSYLRVVDYKTGTKEFRLAHAMEGINLQMLLYLFAICENGFRRYGRLLPAGVLYVPANSKGETLDRSADEAAIERQKKKNGCMSGVILEDETVIRGMEPAARGVYINASIEEDGKLKGALLTLDEFSLLHKRIDDCLRDTGMRLHAGEIPALPLQFDSSSAACDYCDYKSVCLKEQDCARRSLSSLAHDKARKALHEETGEENDHA